MLAESLKSEKARGLPGDVGGKQPHCADEETG